jgi:hypothetical protein
MPGTGDVALSLSQTVPVAGAILVTTPQQVSLADTRRAVRMYQKLNIQPIGVVENMSYYACPNCHQEADIFGHGGGEALATAMTIPFLGRLPVYQPIREGSDSGVPLVVSEPGSAAGRAFLAVAERTAAQLSIAAHKAVEAKGRFRSFRCGRRGHQRSKPARRLRAATRARESDRDGEAWCLDHRGPRRDHDERRCRQDVAAARADRDTVRAGECGRMARPRSRMCPTRRR